MQTFLMSQGGKVEKSGGFPSPHLQTEIEPSAHSGAERLCTEMVKDMSRRRRGANIVFRNLVSLPPALYELYFLQHQLFKINLKGECSFGNCDFTLNKGVILI